MTNAFSYARYAFNHLGHDPEVDQLFQKTIQQLKIRRHRHGIDKICKDKSKFDAFIDKIRSEHALFLLPEIYALYRTFKIRIAKKQQVYILTPHLLCRTLLDKVKTKINRLYSNQTLSYQNIVDQEVVLGIKIVFEDGTTIDGSLQGLMR